MTFAVHSKISLFSCYHDPSHKNFISGIHPDKIYTWNHSTDSNFSTRNDLMIFLNDKTCYGNKLD